MIKSSMQAQPTQANQLTAEPPRLYRAPKINLGDLSTLHKLVAQELTKISQSQSILLTLYEQIKAKSPFYTESGNAIINTAGELRTTAADAKYYGTIYSQTALTEVNYAYPQGARYCYALPQGSVRTATAGGGNQITNNMDYAPTNSSYFAYSAGTGVASGPPGEAAVWDWAGLSNGYRCQLAAVYGNNTLYYRTQNGDSGAWNGWATIAAAAALKSVDHKLRSRIRRVEERLAIFEEAVT